MTVLSVLVFFGQRYLLNRFTKPTVWQWQLDTAALTQVAWQGRHEKWELIRTPQGWIVTDGAFSMVPPIDSVNTLLATYMAWQPRGYSPADPSEWAQYGLNPAYAHLTFHYSGTKPRQSLWLGLAGLPDGSQEAYTRPSWQHDVLLGSPEVGWLAAPLSLMLGKPVFKNESTRPQAVRIRYGADSTLTFTNTSTDWQTDAPYNVVLPVLFELLDSIQVLRFDAVPDKLTAAMPSPLYNLEWESTATTTMLTCWPQDSTHFYMQSSTYPQLIWPVSLARVQQLFGNWTQARRLPTVDNKLRKLNF